MKSNFFYLFLAAFYKLFSVNAFYFKIREEITEQ